MKLYALKYKNNLLKFNASSNSDGEFCVSVAYELNTYGDAIWFTPSKEIAETAAITDEEWYSASYDTPGNIFAGICEVVEMELI